jgi:NADP-dependent 3-hydroxy acid dehydrogenase YdfG
LNFQNEKYFMSPNGDVLSNRCFSMEFQKAFSRLSGDYNPMHDDPIAARRTMAGGQVVHGIHQALAAIEAVIAHLRQQGSPGRAVTGLTALFQKPVLVGETVSFHLAELTFESCQIICKMREDSICQIFIQWGILPATSQDEPPSLRSEPMAELHFDELALKAGSLELGLDTALAREMFPLTMAALGPVGTAEVLSLSRLVGMHCPGLHSLFGQCAVTFHETTGGALLHYRVEQTDARFGKVVMQVSGPRIQGQVTAFFRPPPERQPGMAEVMRLVKPGSFAQSIALIVGGSRGLGEITARLIAAGGGLPIITYHQGAADAERTAADIRSAGGRCEVLQLDVRRGETFIQQLSAAKQMPRSLYYYATPKIFGRRLGFFDHDRLREFQDVYVTSFGRLIDSVVAACPTTLRVFYPSSVAVTETMREMTEYAMAKRAGEELCAFYNRHTKQIEIIVERLPRIRTDQTSTLLPVPAEDGLEVMLPLVRRMEMPFQVQSRNRD